MIRFTFKLSSTLAYVCQELHLYHFNQSLMIAILNKERNNPIYNIINLKYYKKHIYIKRAYFLGIDCVGIII